MRKAGGLEQVLQQMSGELNSLQESGDIALEKNCNVVSHGITEILMKEGKQR